MIGKRCVVRTENAGVFAGMVMKKDGNEVVLSDARRLWYWAGAASLSQLSMEGVTKPNECKFPVSIDEILLIGVIEIIPMTQKAGHSIDSVPVWSA